MKLFGSIFVLSMLSVMANGFTSGLTSSDTTSSYTDYSIPSSLTVPTGHTTGRSRVRARNLSGTNSVDSGTNSENNVSPPTGHTTGRSRVRSRNLRGTTE